MGTKLFGNRPKIKSLNYYIYLFKPALKNYYHVPALHKNLLRMKIYNLYENHA